jgi:GR25 family glycosyltransferase involved in LPS biosynthesis
MNIPIYCIHDSRRTDRKVFLDETIRRHNLLNFTIVEAITPASSPLLTSLITAKKIKPVDAPIYACLLSHDKAMERARNDLLTNRERKSKSSNCVMIMEDDACFRSNLKDELPQVVRAWKSRKFPLLLLSPFVTQSTPKLPRMKTKSTSFHSMGCEIWSMAAYLITLKGLLSKQDVVNKMFAQFETKDFSDLQSFATERVLLQHPNSTYILPPLAIENCRTVSGLTPQNDPFHQRYWKWYADRYEYF